jgi:hypothetical protein
MVKTNSQCVNAGKLGYECVALMKPTKGCLEGKCPFFKTQEDFEKTEKKAKDKCCALGIHFRSRKEVIDEMNGTTKRDLKRLERERKRLKTSKVIQYNSRSNMYIEYDNTEKCADALGIPMEVVESIIRKGEVYKGFKFVIG